MPQAQDTPASSSNGQTQLSPVEELAVRLATTEIKELADFSNGDWKDKFENDESIQGLNKSQISEAFGLARNLITGFNKDEEKETRLLAFIEETKQNIWPQASDTGKWVANVYAQLRLLNPTEADRLRQDEQLRRQNLDEADRLQQDEQGSSQDSATIADQLRRMPRVEYFEAGDLQPTAYISDRREEMPSGAARPEMLQDEQGFSQNSDTEADQLRRMQRFVGHANRLPPRNAQGSSQDSDTEAERLRPMPHLVSRRDAMPNGEARPNRLRRLILRAFGNRRSGPSGQNTPRRR